MKISTRFALVTFGFTILLSLFLIVVFRWDALLAWLLSISAVTFLAYGYDKSIAGSKKTRIPEVVLLWLTFLGGTVGAILGMVVFHHKTSKQSFQVKFGLVIVLQVVCIAVYYLWLKPTFFGG